MSESARDRVADLPPSAKLVYFVLDCEGPLTRDELLEESLLPSRTARSAMDELEEAGVLERKYYFEDGVERLYELVDGAGPESGVEADAEAETAGESELDADPRRPPRVAPNDD